MEATRSPVILISILLACVATVICPPPCFASPRWGADYFPNVPLTTQDGKVVHFYDDLIKGKSVAVDIIYTRCTGSCPLETAKLAQVQKLLGDRMGKDVFFYSISIDPDHDTPAVMKAYAEKFHAGPGWLFLTGNEDDIKLVGKKLGLTSLTDAANRDGHQPSLMIGNEPTGQWMRNSAVDNPRFLATTMINFLGLRKSNAPVHSYADAHLVGNIHQAEYLFHARCAACHTIGGGPGVGPDLAGVTKKRDRAWLARFIIDPDAVFAAGDPIAKEMLAKYHNVRMPLLYVSPQLVPDLLAYIENQEKASPGQGKRDAAVAAAPAAPAHASTRNPAMPP